MNILELNPFYLPYNGGIEKRIAALSSRLSGRHRITVVTSRLPGTEEEETVNGAKVIRLPSRFFSNYNPPFVTSSGIEETIETIGPDVVDYHYRWSGSYNRAFFRSKGRKVMTFHNLYGEGTGALRLLSILNDASYVRKLKQVDHVLAVSDFVKKELEEKGLAPSMLTTCYNGIDMHNCRTSDERFALFIGRLVPTKGVAQLARAALKSGVPLKVAGGGPMLDWLKKQERNGPIEVLGPVNEEEKEKLLSTCTFMVVPSLHEAFGLVALEAMVHGKPVISSDAGGLPEVVGKGGTIVPARDVDAFAAAMKTYWNDESLVSAAGAAARSQSEKFSWDSSVRTIESVYSSVLESDR